jgi:hypothetical protein
VYLHFGEFPVGLSTDLFIIVQVTHTRKFRLTSGGIVVTLRSIVDIDLSGATAASIFRI